MKLKFAKGLKVTAAQKARLQRFEDRLEALSKKEDQIIHDTDRTAEQLGALLSKLDLQFTYVGTTLTVVPLGED